MDWPRVQNGTRCHSKGRHEMDTTRKEKTWQTQRDMEKISGDVATTGRVAEPASSVAHEIVVVGHELMDYVVRCETQEDFDATDARVVAEH